MNLLILWKKQFLKQTDETVNKKVLKAFEHGITPKTIKKSIRDNISITKQEDIGVEFNMENADDIKNTICDKVSK